jgi:hypothetical protein
MRLQTIINEIAALQKLRQKLLNHHATVHACLSTMSEADKERFGYALQTIESLDIRLQQICESALQSLQPVARA